MFTGLVLSDKTVCYLFAVICGSSPDVTGKCSFYQEAIKHNVVQKHASSVICVNCPGGILWSITRVLSFLQQPVVIVRKENQLWTLLEFKPWNACFLAPDNTSFGIFKSSAQIVDNNQCLLTFYDGSFYFDIVFSFCLRNKFLLAILAFYPNWASGPSISGGQVRHALVMAAWLAVCVSYTYCVLRISKNGERLKLAQLTSQCARKLVFA